MMLSPAAREARQRRLSPDRMVYFMLKSSASEALAMDDVRVLHGLPRKYASSRFHVTLLPLGDIRMLSAETMERIVSAAASLQHEPFRIAFHRLDGNH